MKKRIGLAAVADTELARQFPDGDILQLPVQPRYDFSTGRGGLPPPGALGGAPGGGPRGNLGAGVLPLAGFAEPDRVFEPESLPAASQARSEAELAAAAEAFVGLNMTEIERRVIEATIAACGGSLPRAARMLGLSPSTLYRKRARWVDGPKAGPAWSHS